MPAPSRTVLALSGLLLAGCASGGSYGSPGTATPTAVPGAAAVSVSDHPPLGRILVDSAGKTVYFADQESAGALRCTGPCLGFWIPVLITDAAAPAIPGVSGLGVIERKDTGKRQLSLDQKPLYTFKLDKGPGDSAGNNVGDDFGGTHFVWHAAAVGGVATTSMPPAPAPTGYGSY